MVTEAKPHDRIHFILIPFKVAQIGDCQPFANSCNSGHFCYAH